MALDDGAYRTLHQALFGDKSGQIPSLGWERVWQMPSRWSAPAMMNQDVGHSSRWAMYLILCDNGAYYCGISNDVGKRWQRHCAGQGAKYTRMHKPVAMKIIQAAMDESAARQGEYRIKQLSAQAKNELWQRLPLFANTLS